MSYQTVAYFKCGECGVKARSDIIEYDSLGYPICPACGANASPVASTATPRLELSNSEA